MKNFRNQPASELTIGAKVVVLYCGRPSGVVGRPTEIHRVKSLGRKHITLDNGMKVDADGEGMFGVTTNLKEVERDRAEGLARARAAGLL